MADKKINQFDALTDEQVDDDSRLVPYGLSSTGKLFKATVAQMKAVFRPKKTLFVAVGDEGSTITVGAISGKMVLLITRENSVIYEAVSDPAPSEFTFDGTNIVLGADVNPGERFLILYV